MSKFVMSSEVTREELDWGGMAWLSSPSVTGSSHLTVVDASFAVGQGHEFHRHPKQEEMIVVISGVAEQWIGEEKRILRAGDAAHIDPNVVHASFNIGDGELKILAILGPCVSESGYEIEEVENEEPWCNLRKSKSNGSGGG